VFFAIAPGSAGVLAGVHDGDPLSHEAHQGTAHRVWMGLGRAWLRAGLEAGFINLTATADGLAPATLAVPVRG
jgi:beta-galactosidase